MRIETGRLFRRLRNLHEARMLDQSLAKRKGLSWSRMTPCPHPLYDAASAQIGSKIYVIGGYHSLDEVNTTVLVLDPSTGNWAQIGEQPVNLAHSHTAVAGDGARYIYVASGQRGPQCRPAIRDVMSFDTELGLWAALPPLPEPRYAGTMQFWRGRLHFVGGAKEDRWTPAADHWSIAVSAGSAVDSNWTQMKPIPVAGMHRGSAVVADEMFVLGGQQGDFIAIPGDPECRCNGHTQETYLAECFKLGDPSGDWTRVADMSVPVSHIDFATLVHESRIYLLGGQSYKHPEQFYLRLTDAVQAYDPASDRWSIAGHMPYPMKFPVAGVFGGKAIATGGQRSKINTDRPGAVTHDTWEAELPKSVGCVGRTEKSAFAAKRVLFLSHELSLSGAPLLLLETARMLMGEGAQVRVANLGKEAVGWNLDAQMCVPLIPPESALTRAEESDYIIANTVSLNMLNWVRNALSVQPEIARKLVFWVHEVDVDYFLAGSEILKEARLVIFDSEACRQAWVNKLGPFENSVVVRPSVANAMMKQLASERLAFPLHAGTVNSETANLTRAEARARLGLFDDEFLVLNVGLIEPRKGQAMLLRTLARKVKDTGLPMRLALLGFKNKWQRARFLSGMSLSERRVLAPCRAYVRQSDIAGLYRAADAFVMNTQGMDGNGGECFGRVTIEAMAAGAVVLGTDAGGTREIIQDKVSGLLFPVGEAGQSVLAEQLETLVREPSLAARLSEGARRHIDGHFTETRYLSDFAASFEHAFGAS